MEFHYYTGEVVRVGDHVRTGGGHTGIVVEIVLPGTELAQMFHAPDGGVLIQKDWEGSAGLFMAAPDGRNWEDLELIRRASEENGVAGGGG